MMPAKSHAQKRKEKLKKRAEKKPRNNRPEPYFGLHWRQKTDCAHTLLATEIGICSAWLLGAHRFNLCDDDVVEAVENMILRLRAGQNLLPDPDASEQVLDSEQWDSNPEVFADMILRHWYQISKSGSLPGREDLIGILRTILGSISNVRLERPGSTHYLQFVAEWLRKDFDFEMSVVAVDMTASDEDEDNGSQMIDRAAA
ncbi:MAG: hypothetical protein ACKO2L_05440 [Planctomycetaceae bacterium]